LKTSPLPVSPLAALLIWATLHGALYAFLTPLWQAPDEPTHVEYACMLARHGLSLAQGDRDADLQARIIRSLAENNFWHWVREPVPIPLPASLDEDPFFRRAGRQVGDEPPLYYLLPALICRMPLDLPLTVRLMRLTSVGWYVLTVLAAWWAGRGIWPGRVGPVMALAGAVAWLPMLAFLGGAVNNDCLATLLGTLTFGGLVRLVSRPRGEIAAGALSAALLAVATKKTAAFLVVLVPLACAIPLARSWSRWPRGWQIASLALISACLAALIWPSPQPAGWLGRDLGPASGRDPAAATDGRSGIRLVAADGDVASRLVQILEPEQLPTVRGQTVRFSAWVRSAPAADASGSPDVQPIWVTVRDDGGLSRTTGVATTAWTRIEVTHTVRSDTGDLRVAIAIGPGGTAVGAGSGQSGKSASTIPRAVYVDDAQLLVETGPVPRDLLEHGSFERSRSWGRVLWEAAAAPWLAKMRAPVGAPTLARSLLYLVLLFPGFWGNFGWLQVPLPVAVYVVLAGICGAASLGLLLPRRPGAIGLLPPIARWLALGLALAVLQVIVLPMWGRDWQPQARYLHPAIVPILAFGVSGLEYWAARWRLRGALCWYLAGFMLLEAFAVLAVWQPHYYRG
jgi:hypothetical protein